MERARLGTMRRGRRKGDGRLTGKRHLRLFLSSPADERDPWVKEQGHAVRRRVLRTRDAGKEAGLCTRTYGLRARRVAARGKQLGRSCWAAWPKASGLAGQAGPWPEERSGELGRGLLGQKEEGAWLVMLGPDLAFLFPIFIFPN